MAADAEGGAHDALAKLPLGILRNPDLFLDGAHQALVGIGAADEAVLLEPVLVGQPPLLRRQKREHLIQPSGISLDQAVEMVQRRYRAKAVRAETVRNGDRVEHRIRLLSADGKILKQIPTAAREVYDVSGAGDTALASLVLALAAGAPLDQAAQFANAAAGVVVGKLGTATVTPQELTAYVNHR